MNELMIKCGQKRKRIKKATVNGGSCKTFLVKVLHDHFLIFLVSIDRYTHA